MKTLFLLFLFPCMGYAGPYYELVNSTTVGRATMTVSGYIGVAASSTTPTTYKFRIDGPAGYIQFPDATLQTTAYSSSSLSGYALLNATQTFTGLNTGRGFNTPGDFKWKISISSSCGTGWLRSDASSISTTTYSALFAELGYSFGGSTDTFKLPNMNNGEFIRAVSTGTTGVNSMGTLQLDAMQGHYHDMLTDPASGMLVYNPISGGSNLFTGGGATSSVDETTGSPITDGTNGTTRIAVETRPRNYSMIPCIYTGVP